MEVSRSTSITELGAQERALVWSFVSGSRWLCVEAMGMSDPVGQQDTERLCSGTEIRGDQLWIGTERET